MYRPSHLRKNEAHSTRNHAACSFIFLHASFHAPPLRVQCACEGGGAGNPILTRTSFQEYELIQSDAMRISRNYKVDDWKALHFESEADWQKAVDILQDRFETRYLEHIRILIERSTSGFVVLSLDCAIIETLQQFRCGQPKTPDRQVRKSFIAFLTTTPFSEHFDEHLAEIFYYTVRCGLLHQTEAGDTSRIKRGGEIPLVAYTSDHKGIVINTKAFHDSLEKTISDYADQLRDPGSVELRAAFRRKMNFICRIESKPAENAPAPLTP